MTQEELRTGTQRAVFQSFYLLVDVPLLDSLLVRVGDIPYEGDFEAYVAVVAEVVRATLQPRINRLMFELQEAAAGIH